MGAVTFSLDAKLVAVLQRSLNLEILVETGTFEGDTVAEFLNSFNKILSIELSEQLFLKAAARFKQDSHINIILGSSQVKLQQIALELQESSVLYWLDAHWCVASDTAGEVSQCPLLGELRAIGKLNKDSVILIDDARLFLAPPLSPHELSQWPSLDEIITALYEMSQDHQIMVINDVIAFFPRKIKGALEYYAQSSGLDWLAAANCLKENGTFIHQIREKEFVIQGLAHSLFSKEQAMRENEEILSTKINELLNKDTAIESYKSELLEKQAVINELTMALNAYRLTYGKLPFFRHIGRFLTRLSEILKPRLGNLNQYPPRFLSVSSQKSAASDSANNLKISIVTPSFKQGGFIEKTILSILDQNYPNLQYFVQDGGSLDRTVTILKQYEDKLSGWKSEKDSGQSQAINLGFANTDGEIMAWLNSDDLLLPGSLAVVADYFNKHPDVDVVYGNRLLIDENDMEIGRWIMPGHSNTVLSWVDYVPQETMFWRRRIWNKVGAQIDESFRFAMDWDLLVRFRDAGAKFAHIPQFLGAFRIHQNQKTSAAINEIGFHEMNRIRERVLGKVPSHLEIRKAIIPYMLKHILVDLLYRVKVWAA